MKIVTYKDHIEKIDYITMQSIIVWRRRRDLNPRAGCPTYTLSRGASSAS